MFVGRRHIGTVSALIFLIIVAVIAIYSLLLSTAQAYLAVPTIIEKIGLASFTINILIIIITAVIGILLGFVVIAIIQWYPRFMLPLLSLVGMLLLGLAIYLDISAGKHPWDVASSILPLNHSIPLALFTSIIIIAFWLVLIKVVFDRQLRAFHPDALLVHILLNILSIIEKQPRRWPELSFRRQLIPMLEEAATCIQNGLSRQYWSGDGIIDLWLRDTATRQAASLRELKKWVLIPKPDTRNQFIVRIVAGLSQITSGNWDALEQRDPEKISRLQWWCSHATTASRAVFMAILPGLLWWALQQTSLALRGVPAEYVTVGIYIWAALTLIMACDPLFGLKATAFKEVVQSLPGLGSLLGKDKK
jgi:hypothetical protein